ncbi:hypothetical protein [Nostoc sp.]|uniref:hypothetical protein n=1 Tax=Nostoc sp. TaxID=1180 RepID=UPI002FF44BA9
MAWKPPIALLYETLLRSGILRQALASPNGRRPRCFTKIQVVLSAHLWCDQNLKLTELGVWCGNNVFREIGHWE